MTHGSLFSGIGGFDLAAKWAGIENIFQVEIDDFCQKVLTKNFPNTIKYRDIKGFDGTEYRGKIDIISGGFPCQPFSQAGKRKGNQDERALFPEMLRVISDIRPRWIIAENVYGFLNIHDGEYAEEIFSQLENEGYEVQPFIIPASSVGAPHRRDRIWIVAKNTEQLRCNGKIGKEESKFGKFGKFSTRNDAKFSNETTIDPSIKGLPERKESFRLRNWDESWHEVAAEFCRVDARIPSGLDGSISQDEALRTMREHYDTAAMGERSTGLHVCKEKILLKHLLWGMGEITESISEQVCSEKTITEKNINDKVRNMWFNRKSSEASQGRELKERIIRELANTLSKMSFGSSPTKENVGSPKDETEIRKSYNRVENRTDRLKSLGNSIVPQIALILFEAIKQADSE